jgi:DNA-binding transcriptional LysR family regulator
MMDRRRLPLNALRVFETVASAGSVRGGAHQLSITQSAASRHIAVLESTLGVRLFDRQPRGMGLTDAGEILFAAVTRGLDGIQEALNRIHSDRAVRLHAPPAFVTKDFLNLIGNFRRAYPDVSVEIASRSETGGSDEAADLAIVFDRARSAREARDLLMRIVFTPLCAMTAGPRADEPLDDFLNRSELAHVRISGEPESHLWDQFAARLGITLRPRSSITFETADAAARYAAAGNGVMLGEPTRLLEDKGDGLFAPFPEAASDLGYGYFLQSGAEALSTGAVAKLRRWLADSFAFETTGGKRRHSDA